MQFAKLRLSGFKSFVEPTELLIEPGITGVVGPNGCGKSNLVEALRWVMGENSAKRMRGTEMDDVIFGGTSDRPARNLAEVSVHLDNGDRTAPAMFNEHEELEVSRRIERGCGSDYRVNGKAVRARDLQLLFQDNSSGAHSSALVSQGRIGSIINAKPADRRSLLEAAAGITGLHSRRHEAELRLKAAENNLVRLEDVIAAMEGQLAGLKKQARQAARYRSLSDRIRRAEATLLHIRWLAAQADEQSARDGFAEADDGVRAAMVAVTRATAGQAGAAEAVPPLRQGEAAAAAALQRLTVARDGLQAEQDRVEAARRDADRRRDEIQGDIERELALKADAAGALDRLEDESRRLDEEQAGEEEGEAAARAAFDAASEQADAHESALAALSESIAAAEADRRAAEDRIATLESRLTGLQNRSEESERQRDTLEAEIGAAPDIAAAEAKQREAERALDGLREAVATAEAEHQAAESARSDAAQARQQALAELAKLTAEAEALSAVLDTGNSDLFPPVIDSVSVDGGYEMALAAALGDDGSASLDDGAPVHWRTLPALPDDASLPDGVECLARRVRAPDALARRLSQTGLVADEATGKRLSSLLRPGQQLVTRDGARWRWDGYTAAAEAPTAAAVRLTQKNRLAALAKETAAAQGAADRCEAAFEAAGIRQDETREQVRSSRKTLDDAFAELGRTREQLARLGREAAARDSRLSALADTLEQLGADIQQVVGDLEAARGALNALPETETQREAQQAERLALSDARSERERCRNSLDALLREADSRRQRLAAISAEMTTWQDRASGAGNRVTQLKARAEEIAGMVAELADRPATIAAEREALEERIEEAEASRRTAADALAAAESRQSEAERVLKSAEGDLAAAREERVRAEAAVTAAMTACGAIRDRITERLQCAPDQVFALTELKPDAALPEETTVSAQLERLFRERDGMGPVNLRADTEAAELDQQIAGMISERDDLIAAIGRLRQGIGTLNREARERLLASFGTVDGHFRDLFTRLFGGGRAHLKLTEAEDPLDAGLEIYASPPGKRLQHLSLLSGGEQALTALALLFAAFLTRPAPICVLDEVDAPLDDANVDRFCTLLAELASDQATRFLVITHHRMTMARVDRLFGVTMPERGVSQLVSVDLQRAEELRQTA